MMPSVLAKNFITFSTHPAGCLSVVLSDWASLTFPLPQGTFGIWLRLFWLRLDWKTDGDLDGHWHISRHGCNDERLAFYLGQLV